MSASLHQPGTVIGNYELKGLLGRGAMGVVYRARDTRLDRDVALKVMAHGVTTTQEEPLKRFQREAKALARVQHPNIVTVHDVGTHSDGAPYIVMELLNGEDLQAKMRRQSLPLGQKLSVLLQILEGLSHAHGAGVVHRDIKPANIFVCEDGQVKITDFGLARLTEHTMTFSLAGSPAYMSPEQAGESVIDSRSDLFSVGSVGYELFVGKRPFVGDSIPALLYSIVNNRPSFAEFSGSECQAFGDVVRRALEKDPLQRYQTAQAFAEDIKRSSVSAVAKPPVEPSLAGATSVEIADVKGATYVLRAPEIAYPSGFGPSREGRGIKVHRGTQQAFLEWVRIISLGFVSRRETNEKGTEVWQYDISAHLTDGTDVVVGLVDDWNMAYLGGGGAGLLFGKTDLGDSSVKFSEIRKLRVIESADVSITSTPPAVKTRGDAAPSPTPTSPTAVSPRATHDTVATFSRAGGSLPSGDSVHPPMSESERRAAEQASPLLKLALACLARQDYAQAISHATSALQISQHAGGYYARGLSHFGAKDWNRAIEDFTAAIERGPTPALKPLAFTKRGKARAQLGDDLGAISDWDFALKLDPSNAEALLARGTVRRRILEPRKALEDFSEVVRLNPKAAPAYAQRGQVYRELGDVERAQADFKTARDLDPSVDIPISFIAKESLPDDGLRLEEALQTMRVVANLVKMDTLPAQAKSQVLFDLMKIGFPKAIADIAYIRQHVPNDRAEYKLATMLEGPLQAAWPR